MIHNMLLCITETGLSKILPSYEYNIQVRVSTHLLSELQILLLQHANNHIAKQNVKSLHVLTLSLKHKSV